MIYHTTPLPFQQFLYSQKHIFNASLTAKNNVIEFFGVKQGGFQLKKLVLRWLISTLQGASGWFWDTLYVHEKNPKNFLNVEINLYVHT